MKLCIHCIHHSTTTGGDHVCSNVELVQQSPVTGEIVTVFCENLRSSKGDCREDGIHFDGTLGHEDDE